MHKPPVHLGARDVAGVSRTSFDVLVVGAGIHGIWTALSAAEQGWSTLLIERGDFGREASANSLRILHGGFRYLQNLDLPRFYESVAARREWLSRFPSLTRPMGFLFPLDGRALRRRSVLGPALLANDVLSARRNAGLPPAQRIANGAVRGPNTPELSRLQDILPGQRFRDGVASWSDGVIESPARLHVALLGQAARAGATVMNHMEATEICVQNGAVTGVEARDLESGSHLRIAARRIVNCAGAWAPPLARRWSAGSDPSPLLHPPSIAFNLVFRGTLPFPEGLAATTPAGRQLFLYARHGRIFAGTQHLAYTDEPRSAEIPDDAIASFVGELQEAVPGLALHESDLVAIQPGLLTAKEPGSPWMPKRERIVDHSAIGGPKGLVSVSGIKYTTAPIVARKALAMVFGATNPDAKNLHAANLDAANPDAKNLHAMNPNPAPNAAAERGRNHENRPATDVPVFGESTSLDPDGTRSGVVRQGTPIELHERSVEDVLAELTGGGADLLEDWMEREMAPHLDDLLLGRLDGADLGYDLIGLAEQLIDRALWTPARRSAELSRLKDALRTHIPTERNARSKESGSR